MGLKKLVVKPVVRLPVPKLMRALGGAVTARLDRAYPPKPKGVLSLAARVLKKLR